MWPFTKSKSDGSSETVLPEKLGRLEAQQPSEALLKNLEGATPEKSKMEREKHIYGRVLTAAEREVLESSALPWSRPRTAKKDEKCITCCALAGLYNYGGGLAGLCAGFSAVDLYYNRYPSRNLLGFNASLIVPFFITIPIGQAAFTSALYDLPMKKDGGNVDRACWYFGSSIIAFVTLPALAVHTLKYHLLRPRGVSYNEMISRNTVTYPGFARHQPLGHWKPIQCMFAKDFAVITAVIASLLPGCYPTKLITHTENRAMKGLGITDPSLIRK